MDKNISPDSKSNQLAALLNENMEKGGAKMNKARVRLVSMVIPDLCKVQTVSFHKLALAFDNASTADSWLRRLQRFIAGFDLCGDLIARLIFGLLPEKTGLKLVIDRINWKFGGQNINIFMPGIACRNVAFPLMFTMPDKKGNSNSEERITLADRFIRLFGKECVDCIMPGREFVGEKWTGYLNRERIRYYIRIRNNFKVLLPHKGETIPVSRLFRSLKSSGLDIENIHLQNVRRIEKLLCLVMMAFVWCYKAGDYLDRHVKPIPIKKHGHRAKPVFKYGLEYISNNLLNAEN